MITTIAFDADDTLWHNERVFISTREKYARLLQNYHPEDWVNERLDVTESRNIPHFGYGIKAFTLSMIETAYELTEGRISGAEVMEIIGYGREMLAMPIDVLPGVSETIETLAPDYRLMLITKGDLFDQEEKLARSGLGDHFNAVEIVSKKDRATYENILTRHSISPTEFVMIGNAMRSDILPVVEIGATAIHIPYETEWFHEAVSEEELKGKEFVRVENIRDVPGVLAADKR